MALDVGLVSASGRAVGVLRPTGGRWRQSAAGGWPIGSHTSNQRELGGGPGNWPGGRRPGHGFVEYQVRAACRDLPRP